MAASTLPPQAYTRDILAKAYLWMQAQPESMRKMASTPDALVGLFLRAQRNGEVSLESNAPVSRENFVNDLKNLASELEQFDHTPSTHGRAAAAQTQVVAPSPSLHLIQTQTTQTVAQIQNGNALDFFGQIDPKTKELIQDVKDQLNIQSDTEVLRMLVVLGHERIKPLFPAKT